MLSPDVQWVDIDPDQWNNLWTLLHDPRHRPTRLYGLLEGGVPIALIHACQGQIDLEQWPTDAATLKDAAARLRTRLGVDQVILIERDELRQLWESQQRAYQPTDDFASYAVRMGAMTAAVARARAICDPATDTLPDSPVRYAALFDLLRRCVGTRGSFVLAAFSGDDLWFSLAGQLADRQIVAFTTSQGLAEPGVTLPRGDWRQAYRWLVDACRERFETPSLGVFLTVAALTDVLAAADPQTYLREAARTRSAILDPCPPALSLSLPQHGKR